MARRISFLNSQIVVNSGSISNPSNSVSVIKNSERVRNDLLNISEYINGYIYYLTKTLTSFDNYPYDAAEIGLCGDTIVTDINATADSGDVFWFSIGETLGRAKTLKESFEALEAKLIQQQVNISVTQIANLTNLGSQLNDNILLANKVKDSSLGAFFTKDSNALNYPLSKYVYNIYKSIFPGTDVEELNLSTDTFSLPVFNASVSQNVIEGCGSFLSLNEELSSLKSIINGGTCDPTFNVAFDTSYYAQDPINIAGYIQELHDYGIEVSDQVLANALSIVNIENQIGTLQGTSLATSEVAGISELATTSEILLGVGSNGNNKLFISPEEFCNTIINSNLISFTNYTVSTLGLAWKQATSHVLHGNDIVKARNAFNYYVNLIANGQSILLNFGKSYSITTNVASSTCTINNIEESEDGEILRVKKQHGTNQLVIVNDSGYLFDGVESYTLNTEYECVTFMVNKSAGRIEIISKYIQ